MRKWQEKLSTKMIIAPVAVRRGKEEFPQGFMKAKNTRNKRDLPKLRKDLLIKR